MVEAWPEESLVTLKVWTELDQGIQESMSSFAEAERWDCRMRIVVARKDLLSTFAIVEKAEETRVCGGRATANMFAYSKRGLVYLALLLHLEHARQNVLSGGDARCRPCGLRSCGHIAGR